MKGTQDAGASPSTTVPGKGVRGATWDRGRTDVRFALRRQRIGEERRRKHEQQPPRHGLVWSCPQRRTTGFELLKIGRIRMGDIGAALRTAPLLGRSTD